MTLRKSSFISPILHALSPVLIIALASGTAAAQSTRERPGRFDRNPPNLTVDEPPTPSIVVSPKEDHRIGPGDVIDVQVNMAPELTSVLRVAADGTVLMPYLGRIQTQNKTGDQLSTEIADKLRGEYLKNPIVKVHVRQIYSHTYFIQGAVRRSGVYQIEGNPSLIELLTVGGGLVENHGTTAFIMRRPKARIAELTADAEENQLAQATPASTTAASKELIQPTADDSTKFELLKANIAGLLRGNFSQNLILEPGDIVNIPPSDIFFVAGAVREPGSFLLKDGTTLRQAVSLAQGMTFKAAGSRASIYRDNGSGGRQEIKVDIDAVMRGKADDVALFANDIIIVPNSGFKSTAIPVLTAFGNGFSFGLGNQVP